MRLVLSLLLFCALLPSLSQAQLTWSKSSYPFSSSQGERADFTGDGFPDLIFFDNTGTRLTVLPNEGNGVFDPARAFSASRQGAMALLDFNRDGKTDVAICDGKELVILLGNGDGTLAVDQTVAGACSSVAASDFNRDENPDLAITVDGAANSGDNEVVVYLGDGNGGISGEITSHNVNFNSDAGNPCFLQGKGAVAADFTGDKIADIAIPSPCPNGTFSADALIVGTGDGTGHFTFHKDVEFGFDVFRLHLGDVNQDNKRDLIILGSASAPHFSSTSLFVLQGNGDGTFAVHQISSMDGPDNAIGAAAVADFDGDAIKDAVLEVQSVDPNTAQLVFSMQFL